MSFCLSLCSNVRNHFSSWHYLTHTIHSVYDSILYFIVLGHQDYLNSWSNFSLCSILNRNSEDKSFSFGAGVGVVVTASEVCYKKNVLSVAMVLRVDVCCFCVTAPGMKRGNSGASLDSGVVSAFCFSFLILASSDIGLHCSEFNSVKVFSPL